MFKSEIPTALASHRTSSVQSNPQRGAHHRGTVCLLIGCALSLLSVTGCMVTVGDQERPLISRSPITGEVELLGERWIDKQSSGGITRKQISTEFEERLRLETEGDVYHPNLLMYQAMLGLGLRQSRFDFDTTGVDRDDGTIEEYRLAGQLLSTKPYPFGFYLDKSDDIIPRQFTSPLRVETEHRGMNLSLRNEQWPMQFSYSEGRTQQEGQGSRDRDLYIRDDERFRYQVEHDFSELSKLRFDFDRNEVRQERFGTTFDRKEDRYNLRHNLIFGEKKKHRLDSFLYFLDQSGDYELKQLRWQERMRLRHTDDFETLYSFLYNESKRPELRNDEVRADVGFVHRLYDSLTTTGNIYGSRQDLGDGTVIDEYEGRLGFDYRKKNRWGVFQSGYSISRLNLDQTGGSTIVNVVDERHPFTVAGSLRIQLNKVNIDPGSTLVMDSSRIRTYSEFADYTVDQRNGITEIIIIPGGDNTTDGDQVLSFDYDFFTEPQREEVALAQTFRARQRFNNGISLYYEYEKRDDDISSTETDIIPDEYEINTYGAEYIKGGLRLLAEYSDEESTRSPNKSKRLQGSYLWRPDPDTRFSVYANKSWIDYTTRPAYDIELLTLGGEISRRLTDKYSIASNIDYRKEDDTRQGITEGFQWNTELQYVFRQLRASVGVEYNTLDRLGYETDNTYVYFRVVRKF